MNVAVSPVIKLLWCHYLLIIGILYAHSCWARLILFNLPLGYFTCWSFFWQMGLSPITYWLLQQIQLHLLEIQVSFSLDSEKLSIFMAIPFLQLSRYGWNLFYHLWLNWSKIFSFRILVTNSKQIAACICLLWLIHINDKFCMYNFNLSVLLY